MYASFYKTDKRLSVEEIVKTCYYFQRYKHLDSPPDSIASKIFCKIWHSNLLFKMLCTSSGYNLLILTIERYLAITKPLSYDENIMRNKLWIVLPLIWISGFVLVAPDVFLYEIDGKSCYYTAGTWEKGNALLIYTYFAVVGFLFPGITMIILYVRMANAVIIGYKMQKQLQNSKTKSNMYNKAQQNIFMTCFILVTLYLTCWLWMEIVLIIYISRDTDFPEIVYFSSNVSILFNSAINPFIYTIRYKEYQNHVKLLFKRKKSTVINT